MSILSLMVALNAISRPIYSIQLAFNNSSTLDTKITTEKISIFINNIIGLITSISKHNPRIETSKSQEFRIGK